MTDNNALAQLGLCPFCGGEPISHRVPWGFAISCSECGAQSRPPTANRTDEAEAIAAWNTRTPAPAGEVGELVKACLSAASRLNVDRAYELDAAREADKQGSPEMSLGDGWRENAEKTLKLMGQLKQAAAMLERLAGPVQQAGQRPPALGGGMLKRIKDMSQQAGGDQVELVTQAIADAQHGAPFNGLDWPEAWAHFETLARAALAAMQPAPLDGEG